MEIRKTIDNTPYDDPKHFEKALLRHLAKYNQAAERKDRSEAHRHFGAMTNMEHVLTTKFGYTSERIEELKNGQQLC